MRGDPGQLASRKCYDQPVTNLARVSRSVGRMSLFYAARTVTLESVARSIGNTPEVPWGSILIQSHGGTKQVEHTAGLHSGGTFSWSLGRFLRGMYALLCFAVRTLSSVKRMNGNKTGET